MRFSRLSLERYGRFADCELNFRSGDPDLHIIYGANEAGKTTSLAAVSDLLFGFPQRSPYNFMFDYILLRVGAVLEDGSRTFACRRKKGTAGTLLDTNDAAIDEAPLASMLKGQTRETFSLSFSLDQDALRSGGKAMVEAKNDLGRTLFAAGSGLTGVADELKKLEGEADAIWAPTTSQRRSFTFAHRQLAEATKTIRDAALKPKSWSDARNAMLEAQAALNLARDARDVVQTELRAADRVRRLAPLVRLRDEQTETLLGYETIVDLSVQREDEAERVIREAEEAQRQRSTAEQLKADAENRRDKIEADPTLLEKADEIDQLIADGGAVAKAAQDLVRREAELVVAEALTRRLRAEAGPNADATPSRALAAKLRDLSRTHGENAAARRQIAESRNDLDDRRKRAQDRLDGASAAAASEALIDAVDAARALGSDADARCEGAGLRVEALASSLPALLTRLSPWTGGIDELLVLPEVGDEEIESARSELAEILGQVRREEEQLRHWTEEAEKVALEIGQLATGTVVSEDEIASVRLSRQDCWQPIRENVLAGTPLGSPEAAVADYETSVSRVDEKMVLRFSLAEESSRLSVLERSKASHDLQAKQAQGRIEDARKRYGEAAEAWAARLTAAGLPALEPTRFLTWRSARDAAVEAHRDGLTLRADLASIVGRRDRCRAALAQALEVADAGGPLTPVLAAAERKRAEYEDFTQQRRLAAEQLDQIAAEASALDRRHQRLDDEDASNVTSWREVMDEAGLQLDIVTCGAVLELLDDLRGAIAAEADLRRRVETIRRDASNHMERVEKLSDGSNVPAGDTATRLGALRNCLTAAKSAATLIDSLDEEARRRADQFEEASAKLATADAALAPALAETKSTDRAELSEAIERSRAKRRLTVERASIERRIVEEGDGFTLDELVAAVAASNPDQIASHVSSLDARLGELNDEVAAAATAHGHARSAFTALDAGGTAAVDAASDAEQAKAELEVLAEQYILKRAQALTLKWAIEKYRERHQDPLLLRAGDLFSILTAGRYAALRVDADGSVPRLLGLRDDRRTMVEVGAMSEGTTDQLFLALRLAALEQSVKAGVNLPFLADDLFVNFDDERAEAGFRVLAEVACSTQVLFFTHHPHLVEIAKSVVGDDLHSKCELA